MRLPSGVESDWQEKDESSPSCQGGSDMYQFAVVALLALAALKVADFICDNLPGSERFRSLLTFVAGIGAVLWLDLSLFEEWSIDVRNRDIGMWLTGFIVVGLTVPWRAAFRYLTHDQATSDESLGEHMGLIGRGHIEAA
jgi:hypothetical protein